ncbi:ABC transporter ATP-binding protein/permease [Candidatus Vallotia tarda]|uniref:ABC transporter ATP-binding protein/permease n=1 Tax=Candidatus Vallotiella hemipterorum TaxID=1177213 RepID=A0A916JX23_9BURK|nr:ABC transporter ATP-binding protein/permease [Candidatus Vallotia tarda]CAG7603394.1 ABC transporter ATP-binding protein/permease [Candidatus Vallotia tarda]
MSQPASVTNEHITTWSLIKPYWVSNEKWAARGLLSLVVAINMIMIGVNAWFNTWQRVFFDAIQQYNYPVFRHSLLQFTAIAIALILLGSYRMYFRQMIEFRWRQWITAQYMHEWLSGRSYYHIERDKLIDNPDQRISIDLQEMASTTLTLSLDFLSTFVTLLWFGNVLWNLAGSLNFAVFGINITVPGYMVWTSFLYAVVGSYITHRVNNPLASINYQQQRVEADFRFSLIRLRENADQIALYEGERSEERALQGSFKHIRDNWRMIMRYTRRLNFVMVSYSQLAIVFPFIAAAPKYFAQTVSYGGYQQTISAFGTVSSSFSWFISSYSTLAAWRAVTNRLKEFRRIIIQPKLLESAMQAAKHDGIYTRITNTTALRVRELRLLHPDGTPLSTIGKIDISPGSRVLVRGASGSGKSILLRSLAGLWPFGSGTIEIPANARLMFVPQKSYVPICRLKSVLSYSTNANNFTNVDCINVLQACRLGKLVDKLYVSDHWERVLSPGEQQRLAIARVLLQKPDFLFLDESTSALDLETEAALYQVLRQYLAHAAIVSVAHRESVQVMHEEMIEVVSDDDYS